MLIKSSQIEKRNRVMTTIKNGKTPVTAGGRTSSTRKVLRVCPAKRALAAVTHASAAAARPHKITTMDDQDDSAMDPCDNSNDSGLGLEHSSSQFIMTSLDNIIDDTRDMEHMQPRSKRSRLALKSDNNVENNCSSQGKFGFTVRKQEVDKDGELPVMPVLPLSGPVCATTRDGRVTLSITSQPEQQHRARYQTEGSRGAVKDRNGQGFPLVRLTGYDKPARLQVFIGADVDRVTPHMFYQACRVCGKNSTPCTEQKVEGTIVIELQFEPSKKMVVTCDCVGILKERNVDVEHRFPDESASRSKKKSTRCRMVFRTCVERPDGTFETLQVVSQAIACTQLPGGPEICKRSLNSSPCTGGAELFVLGKNFLKDTRVVFQQPMPSSTGKSSYVWEEEVIPDKEYLQPTHLVCVIPAFHRQDLTEPVSIRLFVRSNGKCSEAQSFLYLPVENNGAILSTTTTQSVGGGATLPLAPVVVEHIQNKSAPSLQEHITMPLIVPALLPSQGGQVVGKVNSLMPNTTLVMFNQPTSQGLVKIKPATPPAVKEAPISITQQQLMELIRQKLSETVTPNSSICPIEANLLQQFVSETSGSPLPAQSGSSVEKFLSKIESRESVKPLQTQVELVKDLKPIVTESLLNPTTALAPLTLKQENFVEIPSSRPMLLTDTTPSLLDQGDPVMNLVDQTTPLLPSTMMQEVSFNDSTSQLVSESVPMVLLNTPDQFQPTNDSRVELDSDAHLINTQLGQLLTTDLVPEGSSTVVGGGPLVRDVLLGSGTSVVLPPRLGLDAHKKAEGGLLPQELTHMSDKDLLSYINPGCFDQVMP